VWRLVVYSRSPVCVWGRRKGPMKLLSNKVRGLGSFDKRNEVRRLVSEKNPFILCIQEIKLGVVNDLLVKSMWGNSPCSYSYQSSKGASGGLLTVWDTDVVDVWSTSNLSHALVIRGRIIRTSQDFVIVNVYAPCGTVAKQVLWNQLSGFVLNNGDANLCLCGDFNSVRSSEERKHRGSVFRQHDTNIFNAFITDSLLVDLPICGRLFTWYRGDDYSMSRLDRFLLSYNWCSAWRNSV